MSKEVRDLKAEERSFAEEEHVSEEELFEDCVENVDDLDEVTDEEYLNEIERQLSSEEIATRKDEALRFKESGNSLFKQQEYKEAEKMYTCALKVCPLQCCEERSVLYNNRAASRCHLQSLKAKQKAIDDCGKAIKFNGNYLKPYLRRASLYRELGNDNLDFALKDYNKVLELDESNKEAKIAAFELQREIEERNERLKTEMLGKLKDLGNLVLRPFGLSTENFQLQQNSETGGYSINFKQ